MTEDIISRIDQAVGCQQCAKALMPNGPSPDFCSEECQRMWHATLASKPWPGSVADALLEAMDRVSFGEVPIVRRGVPLPGFRPVNPDVDRAALLDPPARPVLPDWLSLDPAATQREVTAAFERHSEQMIAGPVPDLEIELVVDSARFEAALEGMRGWLSRVIERWNR